MYSGYCIFFLDNTYSVLGRRPRSVCSVIRAPSHVFNRVPSLGKRLRSAHTHRVPSLGKRLRSARTRLVPSWGKYCALRAPCSVLRATCSIVFHHWGKGYALPAFTVFAILFICSSVWCATVKVFMLKVRVKYFWKLFFLWSPLFNVSPLMD